MLRKFGFITSTFRKSHILFGTYLSYLKSYRNVSVFKICVWILVLRRKKQFVDPIHGLQITWYKRIQAFFLKHPVPTALPTYLPTYLPFYQSIYLPIYLPTYLPNCIHTYLPTYSPTYLRNYLTTYLPNHLPSNLTTYQTSLLPTSLPTYPRAYLPTYLPI